MEKKMKNAVETTIYALGSGIKEIMENDREHMESEVGIRLIYVLYKVWQLEDLGSTQTPIVGPYKGIYDDPKALSPKPFTLGVAF